MWFVANNLTLNADKTQTLLLTTRFHDSVNPEFVKFLGISIDPTLTWEKHTSALCQRLCSIVYLLRNLSKCIYTSVLLVAYHSLFHSIASYGLLAWGHSSSAGRVFALQRRAVRILAGISYRSDSRQSFSNLKILTIPALYIYNCLLYAHKNQDKLQTRENIHNYNTRSKASYNFNFLRLSKSRYSANYYCIKFINAVPDTIISYNYDAFKNTVKRILVDNPIYDFDEFFTLKWKDDV